MGKYVFHLEKQNSEPIGSFAHIYHRILDLRKGPANIPLSPNVNKANINSNR